MTPRLVIFDCDGVLVDSEHLSNIVLAEFITESGWALNAPECSTLFVGRRMDDVMAMISGKVGKSLPLGWLAEYERRRDISFKQDLKAIPGIRTVLDILSRNRLAYCVASSGPLSKMHFTLSLTELRTYFPDDILFSARGLPRGKPFPDVFLHAAKQMGADPLDCVVVEDSPAGAAAAKAAGMRCFAYAVAGNSQALIDQNAVCFFTMAQLPTLLGLSPG